MSRFLALLAFTLIAASLPVAAQASDAPAAPGSNTVTVQPPVYPKLQRSTDVTSCPAGKQPCGDSCISGTARCTLPPPHAQPDPVNIPADQNQLKLINPERTTSTDVTSCPSGKQPCGDACLSATARCTLPERPDPTYGVKVGPDGKLDKAVIPDMKSSTDVTSCPEGRKPCGDSCIFATARCGLDE